MFNLRVDYERCPHIPLQCIDRRNRPPNTKYHSNPTPIWNSICYTDFETIVKINHAVVCTGDHYNYNINDLITTATFEVANGWINTCSRTTPHCIIMISCGVHICIKGAIYFQMHLYGKWVNARSAQDNFIRPAPPVSEVPTSKDRLNGNDMSWCLLPSLLLYWFQSLPIHYS